MIERSQPFRTEPRPEAQLVLCCARRQIDAAGAARIAALLQQDIDWRAVVRIAHRHHVTSLVYRSLDAVAPSAIPEAERAELSRQVQAGIQTNLFLTRELLQLLPVFSHHGIPVLPYKGPMLAALVYGDLALRPFSDLDILIHERDLLRALDVLAALGYEVVRPTKVARAAKGDQSRLLGHVARTSTWAYQLVLWHPENRVKVELHWHITPPYVFSCGPDELWRDLRPVAVCGVAIPGLSPEQLLWILCVHGAKHQWERLSWLCDVAELLRVFPDIDWDRLIARARALGAVRRLYLGCWLASHLLTAPLPRAIQKKVEAASEVNALGRRVVESVVDATDDEAAAIRSLEAFAFQLRVMDRMMDRGRYLLNVVRGSDLAAAPEDEGQTLRWYPSVLPYLRRPLRVAKTYGLGSLRRL